MIKELMKEIKNRNKKKSINITLGVIIGYILTSGIVYSEEIPLKKKVIYDEEIKWLWPFEKGSGNTGGEELPSEPEVIPPKKDEIPWEHDPDGIVEDGLEQDSIDMYTGILKREWNKEEKKWKVVGLQDENGDGIADIYNPDGDFDGDGIENKYDKNWALNNENQNNHFLSSNGLGYVDSGNIIKILNKNDWNADELEEYLYHDNKEVFNEGLKGMSENIQFKKINDLKEYNKNYNSKETIDSEEEIKEKLNFLGNEHLTSYNKVPASSTQKDKIEFNDYGSTKNSQIIETKSNGKSLDSAILINKGTIEGNKRTTQASGAVRTGQIVQAARTVKIEESEIVNYGIIRTKIDYDDSFYGQHGGASNGNLINYGIISLEIKSNSNTGDYGGIGQLLGTRNADGKWKAYNYGIIKINNRSGGVTIGQETVNREKNSGKSENELYNYGKILLYSYGDLNTSGSSTDWGVSNSNAGQQLLFQNAEESIGKVYNYSQIELTDQPLKSKGTEVWRYNYGQYAGGYSDSESIKYEIYNYGKVKINSLIGGDQIKESYSYGQYGFLNGSNSKSSIFNYGTLNVGVLNNSQGINSYGQFLNINNGTISIDKNEMYNYGDIEVNGTGETIGQFIRTWSSKAYFDSFMNNYGIIKAEGKGLVSGQFMRGKNGTANNYGQIRVKGETQDTTGMKITDGAKGFNYGIIEVDNKDLTIENMGTGMWADGKDSEAFNYGSIVVTGLTGTVENGMDTAYMRATNGGKVYNYGWLELKDSLEALTIGEGVNSSTKAGYRSAGDFDLKGEMKIMAETGKGDIYSKENFITAGGNGKEGNISGLENLTSSGVYEISTIERKGDNGENVIDLVMNKTKNIENLEKDSNTRRMIKELKLDNAVYGKDSEFAKSNKEFSEMISRKVPEGESLENLLGFEYANLNGQIVESGKVLLENQEKVMNADRTYLSGQFNKENNFDAVIINPQNESKIGIFHLNSDKDLDSHASGTYRYDLESTTLILQNNKNYMIGMNYSKLDYKNKNSNMKKTSVFAGHNYTKSLGDISEYRNYLNGTLTFNSMDRNGKRDNFKSYTLNMRNEYVRELDIKGLTYSEFTAGLKTTVFGHEKIKEHGADLTSDRNIEVKEKIGISNEVNLGILMNKSYELGENKGKNNFGISTYLEYKKELMPIEDWRDEFTIGTGSYTKYNKPVKEHDLGVGLVVISARYEIKDELSGTLSFSADTLGDTMTTFKIEYKF